MPANLSYVFLHWALWPEATLHVEGWQKADALTPQDPIVGPPVVAHDRSLEKSSLEFIFGVIEGVRGKISEGALRSLWGLIDAPEDLKSVTSDCAYAVE